MRATWLMGSMALLATACGDAPPEAAVPTTRPGEAVAVLDTVIAATTEVVGLAEPTESATLATRLMARVLEVTVLEGTRVRAGQRLVRLDVADLVARRRQVEAGRADAEAQRDLARVTVDRMRALFADSAAPRAQLDAAEAGLARAEAGVRSADGIMAELEATAAYGEIRAPFDGVVSSRHVDVGDFVAPGTPLLTVDRRGALRVAVTITPPAAAAIVPGTIVPVVIEGDTTVARVEGVGRSGNGTYTLNAIVANDDARHLGGSAATLLLPSPARPALLVPSRAVTAEGDLRRVVRRTPQGDLVTLVRPGVTVGAWLELVAGVVAGDSVVLSAVGAQP